MEENAKFHKKGTHKTLVEQQLGTPCELVLHGKFGIEFE
jgi:hypothetical protein